MDRREMLKVLTLGLVSGPAALEMFERLNHQRRLFASSEIIEWTELPVMIHGRPSAAVGYRHRRSFLPEPDGPIYASDILHVDRRDGRIHPADVKRLGLNAEAVSLRSIERVLAYDAMTHGKNGMIIAR